MRRLARLLFGAWVGWRWFGPRVPPRYRGVQERPLRVPGRTVFVGHREFFLRETGPVDGPPLVMIHGWNFDGEATYHRVVPGLAAHFRVVLVDLRNHGGSEWIRERVEIDDLADEVAGVLDQLGLSQVPVVGYSMGGMVAQALARRHPGLVSRMVLAATAAFPIRRMRLPYRIGLWFTRALARISPVEGSWLMYRVLTGRGIVADRHQRWLWEELMHRDISLYYESGAAIWRFDSRPWVGRLRQPAQVIVTTADQLVLPAAQYELAGLLADAETVEIVGGGHEAIMDRPDEFVKAITRFAG